MSGEKIPPEEISVFREIIDATIILTPNYSLNSILLTKAVFNV